MIASLNFSVTWKGCAIKTSLLGVLIVAQGIKYLTSVYNYASLNSVFTQWFEDTTELQCRSQSGLGSGIAVAVV